MVRKVARVDANHKEIVDACIGVGASVQTLHQLGGGCPDLLIGFRGCNYLVEVKIEGEEPNELQKYWMLAWNGLPVYVGKSIDDVLRYIGVIE